MSAHDIHGQRVWESLRPAVQARIAASLNAGRWHYAKETLFLPFALTTRAVPECEGWLTNDDQYGTIYVELTNPEDATAEPDKAIIVRAVGSLCAENTDIPSDPFTIPRSALWAGPRIDNSSAFRYPQYIG